MGLDRFAWLPASLAISSALLLCSIGATACGGGQSETAAPKTATTSAPLATATVATAPTSDLPVESSPAGTISRSRMNRALDAGLGAFLQHVTLDDSPVMIDGKFHGFRIDQLHGSMFDGVDLKPGDVVTGVNGFPIERPEQAMEAFQSLAVASELRVEYDRDGQPKELRYPILEDAPVAAPDAADGGAPKAAPAPKPSKATTVRLH